MRRSGSRSPCWFERIHLVSCHACQCTFLLKTCIPSRVCGWLLQAPVCESLSAEAIAQATAQANAPEAVGGAPSALAAAGVLASGGSLSQAAAAASAYASTPAEGAAIAQSVAEVRTFVRACRQNDPAGCFGMWRLFSQVAGVAQQLPVC